MFEIEADSKMSFYQLYVAIQKALKYDTSHPASFYLTNNKWEKEKEVTLIDMNSNDHNNILFMENILLKDHLNTQNQRMLYVYDFFFERAFNVELVQISELKPGSSKNLPKIIRLEGTIPAQILMPEFISGEDSPDEFMDSDPDEGPEFEPLDDLDM